jgi:hypothetical protein
MEAVRLMSAPDILEIQDVYENDTKPIQSDFIWKSILYYVTISSIDFTTEPLTI